MNMNFSEKSNNGLRLPTRTENNAKQCKMLAGDEMPKQQRTFKIQSSLAQLAILLLFLKHYTSYCSGY